MKKILIIIITFLLHPNLYCQEVSINKDSIVQYTIDNINFYLEKVSIENNSNTECILCWIDNCEQTKDNSNSLYKYLFKRIGNFSLYQIINEYGSTLSIDSVNTFSNIFSTFYTIIKPNSSFDIYIINKRESYISDIINSIKIASEDQLRTFFDPSDLNFNALSYKKNYIVIL